MSEKKFWCSLSHDEVVYLKCSMINKCRLGIDKFRNLMAGYAFMMDIRGRSFLFMGQEFAQLWASGVRSASWTGFLDNPITSISRTG